MGVELTALTVAALYGISVEACRADPECARTLFKVEHPGLYLAAEGFIAFCKCKDIVIEIKDRDKGKCKNGTWRVGNCGRNGPVHSKCPGFSPFAIGLTRQQAQENSLKMLPPGCHGTGGASYHHCTAFQCVARQWVPRM